LKWVCGTAPSIPGFVASVQPCVTVPIGLTHLYYICFLSGSSISATVYRLLHFLFPAQAPKNFVESSPQPASLMVEYEQTWDNESSEVFSEDVDKNARVGAREVDYG
jgi:NCS1 family nucleobase:cation symporter-1